MILLKDFFLIKTGPLHKVIRNKRQMFFMQDNLQFWPDDLKSLWKNMSYLMITIMLTDMTVQIFFFSRKKIYLRLSFFYPYFKSIFFPFSYTEYKNKVIYLRDCFETFGKWNMFGNTSAKFKNHTISDMVQSRKRWTIIK